MKTRVKILFVAVILPVCIFGASYIFLAIKGKDLIVSQIERMTRKKVNMGYIGFKAPLSIEIKDLDVQDLIKADYVYISPSITGLFRGKIAFNDVLLIRPEFTYYKNVFSGEEPAAVAAEAPQDQQETAVSKAQTTASKDKKPLRLALKRVRIKDGIINIIDSSVGESGIKVVIKDINFTLRDLYLIPRSTIASFELEGNIPWNGGSETGKIKAEGWLNLYKKDMQASLNIKGIDAIALYPYYAKWVDLDKARIQKAKLSFASDIQGLNNNLVADCHLELTDIVRRPLAENEHEEEASKIANAVFTIFQAMNQGKIAFNFTVRTTMDNPRFAFSQIKDAFEMKIAEGRKATGIKAEDIFKLPGHVVAGTVKGASDVSRAVIIGTVAVGKELKNAFAASFRREKKED